LLLLLQALKALVDLCMRAMQQHSSPATQHLVNKSMELLPAHCCDEKVMSVLGSSLSAAVLQQLQQLQQAGLPQNLSALLTHTAQDLTATAADSARLQLMELTVVALNMAVRAAPPAPAAAAAVAVAAAAAPQRAARSVMQRTWWPAFK
jgi:hypothetical protein